MFLANMDAADKMEESEEDMTAADTAPSPTKETAAGVRYCRTMGRTRDVWAASRGSSPVKAVWFQAKQEERYVFLCSSQSKLSLNKYDFLYNFYN